MNIHSPKQFKLTEGVNAYDPEIVAEELTFAYLTSVEPRLGRLMASRGFTSFQSFSSLGTSQAIVGFAFYQLSNRRFANLYAFSKTSVYWFDFSANAFNTTPIYSSFVASDDNYVFLPWYDALYVTKLGNKYVELNRATATEIEGGISGRYGIVANSHAYLGGVSDGVSIELARTRWSDLDAPKSFDFDAQASEADFFDLEPDSRQITGLSYQRGVSLIYAENTLWAGSYVGFPGGFRHDPIFPGLGNIFHDAVVRAKEIDYFIGQDNFYALNGLQPVPIGDKIFERFIADVVVAPTAGLANTSVKGYLDTRKNQVFWVYPSIAHGKWSVVYNYKENKWSERDPQQLTAFLDSPKTALRGYDSIDSISTIINNATQLIDDPAEGYPLIIPQLAGLLNPVTTGGTPIVGKGTDSYIKLDNSEFDHKVETTDFFFTDFAKVKEVTRVNIEYTGSGTPNLQIQVGTRHNQSEAITWSAAIDFVNQDGSISFFVRETGVGKYLRFRFLWNNDSTNYITDLRLVAFEKVEGQNGDPQK